MISLGSSVNVTIGDGVSIDDFINNPNNHYWEVYFEFPSDEYRDSRSTPTGRKYGTDSSFASIYDMLKMPFIDVYFNNDYMFSNVKRYGDDLLRALNSRIGIEVENLRTKEGEVYSISKNLRTNKTRLDNAVERYEEYQYKYDMFQDDLNYIESSIKLTKHGTYDRRTANYHLYTRKLEENYRMREQLDYLKERVFIEQNRYENSVARGTDATDMLRRIKSGTWKDIQSDYYRMAERYAEMVKDDIIGKARSGVLPMQNLPLAEETIKKRRYAGIPATPRFWATGQLVESIVITCTLV